MFDLNKLGDVAKLANEAKGMQERQEKVSTEQLEMLKKISAQIESLASFLQKP